MRAADRRPQPWRNGGGETSEVIVQPPGAGMDDFDWRLSIALVDREGAFSHFEGIDRVLAVLEGELELADDQETIRLDRHSKPLAFPGDMPLAGRPCGGAVRDLNLMVRRGQWLGHMHRSLASRLVTRRQTSIVIPQTAVTIEVDGVKVDLAPLDALILERGCHVTLPCPFMLVEVEPAARSAKPGT